MAGASRTWLVAALVLPALPHLAACRVGSSAESDGGSDEAATDGADTTSESESESGEPDEGWQDVLRSNVETGGLWAVFGHSPDEVLAVGGQVEADSSTGTVVVRNAAGEWAFENPPIELAALTWVSGLEDGYVVAGRSGTVALRDADGVWEPLETDSTALLWGVWGPSEDELYTVGTDTMGSPVILARDGDSFAPVEIPPTQLDATSLFKVWGRGSQDIVVVGDLGWLLGFDGTEWTEYDSTALGDLISVWGNDTATVAVGGRSNGRLVVREGGPGPDAQWTDIQLVEPGLTGVYIDDEGRGTAVGNMGTILSFDVGDLVDETSLSKEESPTPLLLHAVFGFSNNLRIAVGGNLGMSPPYVGIILENAD